MLSIQWQQMLFVSLDFVRVKKKGAHLEHLSSSSIMGPDTKRARAKLVSNGLAT